MVPKPVFRGRRALFITLGSAIGVLLLAAVPVQVTGSGIDLYALLVAGVLLLVAERTAGDWVANLLGPAGTALAFALVAAAGVAYLLSDGGQKRAERFMVVAEAHGYRPAYFKLEHNDLDDAQKEAAERVAQLSDPFPPAQTAATPASSGTPSASGEAASARATPQSANSGFSVFFSGRPREEATGRLVADPELAQPNDDVRLRFVVIGQPKKMPTEVIFSVNGIFLSRQRVGPKGTAEAHWHPRLPGEYHARADTDDSSLEARGFNIKVQVVPSRR
jgi:hypothetical protein